MTTAIGDEAARVFSAQFYSALSFGKSIRRAFEQARAQLLLEGIPEEDTPELFVKDGLDPDEIVLVRPAGFSPKDPPQGSTSVPSQPDRAESRRRLEKVGELVVDVYRAAIDVENQQTPPITLPTTQARLRQALVGLEDELPVTNSLAHRDGSPAGRGQVIREWQTAQAEVTEAIRRLG